MNLLNTVPYDKLDDNAKWLVDAIGLEAFKTLVRNAGGSTIVIPTEKNTVRNYRNSLIIAECNGYNFRELALKYCLTDRAIRNIVDKVGKQL